MQSVTVVVDVVVVVVVCQRYVQLTENFLKGENPAVVRSRMSSSRAAEDQTDILTDVNGQIHDNIQINVLIKKLNSTRLTFNFLTVINRNPRPSGDCLPLGGGACGE